MKVGFLQGTLAQLKLLGGFEEEVLDVENDFERFPAGVLSLEVLDEVGREELAEK